MCCTSFDYRRHPGKPLAPAFPEDLPTNAMYTHITGLENLDIGPEGRNTTSHAQRHLNAVLSKEMEVPDFYKMKIPGHDKTDSVRQMLDITLRLPHECLLDDHTADPIAMEAFLDEHPHFRTHKVVKSAVDNGRLISDVVPCSLYVDGVQYTKRDTFVGFYVDNLMSRKKNLICAVRS